MSDLLIDLHAEVSEHLEKICKLFKQRPNITIVIRTPWLKDGGIVLSDDDLDAAIGEINRLRTRKPIVEPNA